MNLSGKVLVVEPDEDQRDALGYLLEAYGIRCALAKDVAEAEAHLEAEGCDLAILDYDVILPEPPALLRRLEAAKVPSLVLSGRGAADLPRGMEILRKPLDIDAFLARINALAPALNLEAPAQVTVELALYVAGGTPASERAAQVMREAVAGRDDVVLEVIDLVAQPQRVRPADRVIFTPTVVRRRPQPQVWVVGDPAPHLSSLLGPRADP